MGAEQRHAGGRPRTFDETQALDRAIAVFWRLGFEGASLAELTDAMGINKPSLYAVFGSKEELFIRALERYRQTYHGHLRHLLAQPRAYDILESYLRDTAKAVRAGTAPGCLSIHGGISCGPTNARIPQLLAEYRRGIEDAIAKALAAADDSADIDATALAGFAVTIGQGLAVDAAAGVPQARLDAAVDVALAGLASLIGPPSP
ncbi:TetR/AcrR family transcriptional regulator [Mycolicibacterium sp. 018/SC-01/001]|uniref:TetR/AcrR family transcriptional regulator n=1 Tax=Mycolicibacterium sp. 018/SC-01/001 TaxID=2592069 RepID=UPI00117EB672|nr:TetR/AcrR family transcriptional regulator [Mycolicibacterium sp. 018/SC-01/001]TRW87893.1 TetR/AcrR family transcriptional regulator [Mycolicibacterium sp. 018/SC-01/001]